MTLGEELKKVVLLGIGAAAMTAEKSKELVDELVKKGELTVEQGKVLNEELKHNIKQAVGKEEAPKKSVADSLDTLSPEELQALREKLAELDKKDAKE